MHGSEYAWFSCFAPSERPFKQNLGPEDFRFYENGCIYVTSVELLQERKNRIGYNPCIYTISEVEGMQIDTPFELEMIEAILSGKIKDLMG